MCSLLSFSEARENFKDENFKENCILQPINIIVFQLRDLVRIDRETSSFLHSLQNEVEKELDREIQFVRWHSLYASCYIPSNPLRKKFSIWFIHRSKTKNSPWLIRPILSRHSIQTTGFSSFHPYSILPAIKTMKKLANSGCLSVTSSSRVISVSPTLLLSPFEASLFMSCTLANGRWSERLGDQYINFLVEECFSSFLFISLTCHDKHTITINNRNE